MPFRPKNTRDEGTSFFKTLLYALPGWGKTTQALHYKKKYGKGFIISGEAGLASIRSAGIDYLPFTSWDGEHDPDGDVYSFRGICRIISSDDFVKAGYKWIMLDSLTELSDLAIESIKAELEAAGQGDNGFAVWGDYANAMIGACKWVRDLPYHVVVTALAKEDKNPDGEVEYWPMIKGSAAQKQLPGIFDNVLCGVRTSEKDDDGKNKVIRYVVTDELAGYHGKVRDENRVLKPWEKTGDITDLFDKMKASSSTGG